MSSEQQIIARLDDLQKSVTELRNAVVGDKIIGKPGMVDVLDTHRRELYGDEATKHVGLKERQQADDKRLTSLEDSRKWVKWTALGVAAAWSTAWSAVLYWFKKP